MDILAYIQSLSLSNRSVALQQAYNPKGKLVYNSEKRTWRSLH